MTTIKIPDRIQHDIKAWDDRAKKIMGQMKCLEMERQIYISKIWYEIFKAEPAAAIKACAYDADKMEITFGEIEEVMRNEQE